jgi:hypothetical protein
MRGTRLRIAFFRRDGTRKYEKAAENDEMDDDSHRQKRTTPK